MLVDKIRNRESGIIVYGITPPKAGTDDEKLTEIARKQLDRLKPLDIDGLILYDIQDEADRTSKQRPFPYLETLDAQYYSDTYLSELDTPRIVYRASGKYTKQELTSFLTSGQNNELLSVFVGAASSTSDQGHLSLKQAYALKQQINPEMLLGGVTIPERHSKKGDEHLRVFNKIEQGCSFFVSQGVYDITASKNFLSEYYYYGREHNIPLQPILFTLTPCGSAKTLEFMKWLGISIPKWLENELINSGDILEKSVEYSAQNWAELKEFADEKNIPIGCNIESVAVRKVEVDASIELLKRVAGY